MRLLADQDVYAVTVRFLRDSGHDVATAAELGMSRSEDVELLQAARNEKRLFLTRDRDFGGLVFVNALGGGVLYLRVFPGSLRAIHAELDRVLQLYEADELRQAFVVIESGRHRMRRASGGSP